MKALLDTNIIIHRETTKVISQDIGLLFKWLEKCHYIKCVHSATIEEIKKNPNKSTVDSFLIKLSSYEQITIPSPIHDEVLRVSSLLDSTPNDKIDTQLLNEVYVGRVDILVTEDKKIHTKAKHLKIQDKVYNIDSFLEKAFADNPNLVDYKILNVRKRKFGEINLMDPFFDSLRTDYSGFDKWFVSKYDEEAYITENADNKKLLSFLYLKIEDTTENYSDISPLFVPKRRLKIGTLKIISNGFRLGERFLKIIFDNALKNKVQEIYVTIFDKRDEQRRLITLLEQWGFVYWGTKNGEEKVYVRNFSPNFNINNIRGCFPYVSRVQNCFIVSIYSKYHTELLPDSILNTESPLNFVENFPHRNCIGKVYVSRFLKPYPNKGDLIIFYRTGGYYKGVVTSLCIVEEVRDRFSSKDEFLSYCRKSSVYSNEELVELWEYSKGSPVATKFLYTYSFPHRINMSELIRLGVLSGIDDAPRGFKKITTDKLNTILKATQSNESFIVN